MNDIDGTAGEHKLVEVSQERKKKFMFTMEKEKTKIDTNKVEKAVRLFLEAIGEDCDREGLLETPSRVAKMCCEVFERSVQENEAGLFKSFSSNIDGLVMVKDISFCSFCEHHLMPFFGKVHVAYLPEGKVMGLSKFARLVDYYSGRLQLQENLTESIANAILQKSVAKGVMVVVDGFHSCMSLRGVKKLDSRTLTFVSKGVCAKNDGFKTDFFKFIGLN